jgi:hypothetical protein
VFLQKVIQVESAGKVTARARGGRSSAAGLFQFTDDTFLSLVRENEPDLAGVSDEEILAKRTEDSLEAKALQHRMARVLTRENAQALERGGIEVTDANKYALHFLGQGDGVEMLSADDDAPITDVVSEGVIKANKNIKHNGKKFGEWTVADFKSWTEKKMEDAEDG